MAAVQVDKFKQNKDALLTDPEFEWIIKAIEGDDQATRGRTTRQLALLDQVVIDSVEVYQTYWPTKGQGKLTDTSMQLQWIVLQGLQAELLALYHDTPSRGHLGRDKVFGKLVTHYWWPGMWNNVDEWV